MSKMFPALAAAAAVALGAASAKSETLFARADCRVATVNEVLHGQTLERESVILCKRLPKLEALLKPSRQPLVARSVEPPSPDREERVVAFGAPGQSSVECARLDCPTFVLGGVGF